MSARIPVIRWAQSQITDIIFSTHWFAGSVSASRGSCEHDAWLSALTVRTRRGRFEGGARRVARAHTLGQPLLHASSKAETPDMDVRRAVAIRARSISREDAILFFSLETRMTRNPERLKKQRLNYEDSVLNVDSPSRSWTQGKGKGGARLSFHSSARSHGHAACEQPLRTRVGRARNTLGMRAGELR